jgi:hypothetical protein
MTRTRAAWTSKGPIVLALAIGMGMGCKHVEERPVVEEAVPLWNGTESVAAYAQRVDLETELTLDLGGGVKMEFVLIPAGTFLMGSPDDEEGRTDPEGPQHEVTIGKPFYMGKFEVPQEQYEKLIKRNPSRFKGARNTVERVSWYDAQAFCKQMKRVLPAGELKPIALDAPVYQMPFKIKSVDFEELVKVQDLKLNVPVLEGITIDGQLAVSYSPLSLSNGWEQLKFAYNRGYASDDALRIGVNIIAYAMTR